MRDEGTSHEDHWWKRVEAFVTNFNEYLTQIFSSFDLIYANESISRWYGQVVHWVHLGLPMCLLTDRKPDNGAEIQNAACGFVDYDAA